jgi:hypothetical protein
METPRRKREDRIMDHDLSAALDSHRSLVYARWAELARQPHPTSPLAASLHAMMDWIWDEVHSHLQMGNLRDGSVECHWSEGDGIGRFFACGHRAFREALLALTTDGEVDIKKTAAAVEELSSAFARVHVAWVRNAAGFPRVRSAPLAAASANRGRLASTQRERRLASPREVGILTS